MTADRTTLSRNGQITIPITIRQALRLRPGDELVVEQHGQAILVRRALSSAERTAGSLAKYRKDPPLSPAEERAWFEQAVADDVASESG